MSAEDKVLAGFRLMKSSIRHIRRRSMRLGRYDASDVLESTVNVDLPSGYVWVHDPQGDRRISSPAKNLTTEYARGVAVIVAYNVDSQEDDVIGVDTVLAPIEQGSAAGGLNSPQKPASFSTPVSARDILPGGVFADSGGGLNVRIGEYQHEGGYYADSTALTLTPTVTSGQKSLAVVGVNRLTNAATFTLTANRASAFTLIMNGKPTSYAQTDIQAVIDADPEIDWRGAVELANGATTINPAKIVPLPWLKAVMVGATVSTDGVPGLVPAAVSADKDKYLKADGTFDTPASLSSLPAFGAAATKTLASDVASAGSDRHLIIAAQSGTADNLIEITGLSTGDEVIIRADAGDTITVKHNDAGATDKILLYNAADIALSGDKTLKLNKIASGKVVQYVDEVGSGASAAGTIWSPLAAPSSAGADDDEFADNSGGVPGGWTEWDHGTSTTVAEAADGLRLTQATHAGRLAGGIYKAIPAGDFSIWTYCALRVGAVGASQVAYGALMLFADATVSTGDTVGLFVSVEASNVATIGVFTAADYTATPSAVATVTGNRGTIPSGIYFRIRRTAGTTTYTFEFSYDGLSATQIYTTAALGITPTHYGLIMDNVNTGADVRVVFPYFRYSSSNVGITAPMEGRRINYYV